MLGRDENANMMFRLLKQIQLDQFRFPSVTMECFTFTSFTIKLRK